MTKRKAKADTPAPAAVADVTPDATPAVAADVTPDVTPVVGSAEVKAVEAPTIKTINGFTAVDNTNEPKAPVAVEGKPSKPVETLSGIKQVNYS